MDAQVAIQKLETEKIEVAGDSRTGVAIPRRTQRTQSDEAIAHAENLVKILTHKIQ